MSRSGLARRFARELQHGNFIERRVYPAGFARAGGARLPLQQRSEAIEEIEGETKGVGAVQAHIIVQRVVKKYERISAADATQLSYGRTTVPTYEDPDARSRARRMLLYVAAAPGFDGCLDEDEMKVWVLSFTGDDTQTVIAERMGKSRSTVSKLLHRGVRKLNARYLELRAADRLPLAIVAWVKDTAGSVQNPSFKDAVRVLQRRDRSRKTGGEDSSTGCNDMDGLAIRQG
jgi:hypothetical protein